MKSILFNSEIMEEIIKNGPSIGPVILYEVEFENSVGYFYKDFISEKSTSHTEIAIKWAALLLQHHENAYSLNLQVGFTEKTNTHVGIKEYVGIKESVEYYNLDKTSFNFTVDGTMGIGWYSDDVLRSYLLFQRSDAYSRMRTSIEAITKLLNNHLPGEKIFELKNF